MSKTVDKNSNEYRSAIWVAPFKGGSPRQFTSGPGQDSAPAWSPGGRWLAFLSGRGSRTAEGIEAARRARETDPS